MAKTDQRFNNGCSVIALLLVGVTSIAVGVTHTDTCDQPLNIWLLVFGAVMVFTALVCLAFCALIWDKDADAAMLRKKSTAGKLIQALLSVIGIALIGWFFVGGYWLWKTDDCEAQSEVTYRTVEAMLGMLCVTSGCIALCLCQACLVGRRGRVGAFQPLRDPEGDL